MDEAPITQRELTLVQDIVGSPGPLPESELRRIYERFRSHFAEPIQMLAPVRLGECLRRLREIREVYMGDVARALGVSVAQVSDWELNRAPMTNDEQRQYLSVIFDAVELNEAPSYAVDRVTELLEKNTALVNELRRVDRQRQVREFHVVVVGSALPEYPGVPPEPILRRQARLITEEYLEAMEAIYGSGQVHDTGHDIDFLRSNATNLYEATKLLENIVDQAPLSVDLPALIDATVDLDYVVEGMRCWCGIDSQGAWSIVQAANMAKAGGPRRASDQKMLKPPGWKPPDLAAEIKRQQEVALARQRGPK